MRRERIVATRSRGSFDAEAAFYGAEFALDEKGRRVARYAPGTTSNPANPRRTTHLKRFSSASRQSLVTVCFVLAPLTAGHVRAGERVVGGSLVEDAPTSSQVLQSTGPAVRRERAVRVDFDAVRRFAARSGNRIVVDLFEGARVTLIAQKRDREHDSALVVTGRIEEDPLGSFALSAVDDVMAADVRGPTIGYYQVRSVGDGLHAVREIDQSAFPPCSGVERPRLPIDRGETLPAPRGGGTSTIDVLIVYTPAARAEAGSAAALRVEMILAFAIANSALENSETLARFRMVGIAETSYVESGDFPMDLAAVRDTNDGEMDEVHALRDSVCADLVSLIVESDPYPDGCGRANIMDNPGPAFAPEAFSVVRLDCAAGNMTLAHELAHNLGCHHDRFSGCTMDACTSVCCTGDPTRELDAGAFEYSHGYLIPDQWRTIMAYPDGCTFCPRIPYYSNPNVIYQQNATGVAGGHPTGADNALTIEQTRAIAEGFRASCPGACCAIGGSCSEVNETACALSGGFFQGEGTTCAPEVCRLGACCDRVLFSCGDGLLEEECRGLSREWSEGVLCGAVDPACAPPVGRCCLPDDSCVETTSTNCYQLGGRSGTEGSACAGGGGGDAACAESILYYHHDATGNLLAMTDASAQVVWRAEVEPFGRGTPTPSNRPMRFVEQPREVEIDGQGGLYHLGARTLDPSTGRFVSTDPLSLTEVPRESPQNFNRFSYAVNNPYRFRDATGRQSEEEAEKKKAERAKKIKDISKLVSKDEKFVESVDSGLKYVPFISSGSVRNFGYFVSGRDPGDPETDKRVCTGISTQAEILINKAIKDGNLSGVKRATSIERRNQPGREDSWVWHTAVLVEFDDGSKVVLDWHATLDPQNPKVTTPEDF